MGGLVYVARIGRVAQPAPRSSGKYGDTGIGRGVGDGVERDASVDGISAQYLELGAAGRGVAPPVRIRSALLDPSPIAAQGGVWLAPGASDAVHPRPEQGAESRRHSTSYRNDPYTAVFFLDEADIDFNPRIGYGWRERGRQEAIPTPGQNQKHYVAGALHARTGRLAWVEYHRKNSVLFLKMLVELRKRYRRAQRIVLILDNYKIHKSHLVERWLQNNPKFELLFQPVYHPWVNEIERLWKTMHDTVTRNHRCRSMTELCQHIIRFFDVVQPFPGNRHGVAQLGSAI
jgi:transposase